MSRIETKKYNQLTEAQQAVFDHIVANRPVRPHDGHIGGPFDIWLRSPELGRRLVDLGGYFRFHTSVARRYIELVILTTGAHWQAQFEWWAHEPMAREAGVPDTVIGSIKRGDRPVFDDPRDEAAYALANEMQTQKRLADQTFNRAKELFGESGVAELIALCGFYTLVSMTLNGFEVELPPGATPPFPETR